MAPSLARLAASVVGLGGLLLTSTASATTVRADRPRILFSSGAGPGITTATFKARCTGTDAAYKRCAGSIGGSGGGYDAMSAAAAYLVKGDAAKCADAFTRVQTIAKDDPTTAPDAHGFISDNGRGMIQLAAVRDWCDPVLDATQKKWLEDRMVLWADWYLATYGTPTGLPSDVFHDDMTNVWNSVALAGLALTGTAQDAKAKTYVARAETQWKEIILPAMAYVGDWWHEGFTYVQPTIGGLAWWAAAWSTATDDDVYAYVKAKAGDLIEGYFAFHAYAMRPDYNYVYFGDTAFQKQSIELFTRPLIDLLNYGAKSPVGQGFSRVVADNARPFYDYSGADGWLMALLWDASKDATATPLSSLPTARWLSKGANDVAVMRSGWGKDDTYVWMSCGDYLGAHQHDEAGAFQIFRHSLLTGSDGYYDSFDTDHWANYYSQHSVHANTLSIYMPGELFPTSKTLTGGANVNDGGQRTLRRNKDGTGYPSPDLATYVKNKSSGPFYETGNLKTFESAKCHDYVACDVTAAYDAPGFTTNGNKAKVKEVTRQLVFLRPELIVVFDRIESTDASYDKRFLLHALAAPDVKGSDFTVTNGTGRLLGKTLLPASADLKVLTNFDVDGTPHPPSSTGPESGGTRLEVSPKTEGVRDYFLHVLDATDPSKTALPPSTVSETDTTATVTISDSASTYVLTFAKTGDLGGHLRVTTGGAVTCDQDLGKEATPGPDAGPISDSGPGGDGGSPADGGVGDDGGGTGNPAAGDGGSSGGCGCRTSESATTSHGAMIVALLSVSLVTARRRARRRAFASPLRH